MLARASRRGVKLHDILVRNSYFKLGCSKISQALVERPRYMVAGPQGSFLIRIAL